MWKGEREIWRIKLRHGWRERDRVKERKKERVLSTERETEWGVGGSEPQSWAVHSVWKSFAKHAKSFCLKSSRFASYARTRVHKHTHTYTELWKFWNPKNMLQSGVFPCRFLGNMNKYTNTEPKQHAWAHRVLTPRLKMTERSFQWLTHSVFWINMLLFIYLQCVMGGRGHVCLYFLFSKDITWALKALCWKWKGLHRPLVNWGYSGKIEP